MERVFVSDHVAQEVIFKVITFDDVLVLCISEAEHFEFRGRVKRRRLSGEGIGGEKNSKEAEKEAKALFEIF